MKEITLFDYTNKPKLFVVKDKNIKNIVYEIVARDEILHIYYNDNTVYHIGTHFSRLFDLVETRITFNDINLLDKLPNTDCYDRADKLLELTGWEFLD